MLSTVQIFTFSLCMTVAFAQTALDCTATITEADGTTMTAVNAGKSFCSDCLTISRCGDAATDEPTVQDTCGAGQACGYFAPGIPGCMPIANTECACTTDICDSYTIDPSVVICRSNVIFGVKLCTDATAQCEAIECTANAAAAADPMCETGVTGFVSNPPDCLKGVYCDGGTQLGPLVTCQTGQYFDATAGACRSASELNFCEGCADGFCPNKIDCTKYVICVGGEVVSDKTCNDELTFNFETLSCDDVDNCDVNTQCAALQSAATTTAPGATTAAPGATTAAPGATTAAPGATTAAPGATTAAPGATTASTTAVPSTRPATCSASNVNMNYPDETSCTKYWSCRLQRDGTYQYRNVECLSSLQFDASTGRCDLATVVNCVEP